MNSGDPASAYEILRDISPQPAINPHRLMSAQKTACKLYDSEVLFVVSEIANALVG